MELIQNNTMELIQNNTSLVKLTVTVPDGGQQSNAVSTIIKAVDGYPAGQYVLSAVLIPDGALNNSVTLMGGLTKDTIHELQQEGSPIAVTNADVISPIITFGRPYIAVKGAMAAAGGDVEVELILSRM